jgi:GAF domain-containing protein
LNREQAERRRAECLAKMQAGVVQLALDLLVREPDIESFFGALTQTMVEEGESCSCGVWLIDEERQRCDPWMAYVEDRLYKQVCPSGIFPREAVAEHLFSHKSGWTQTIEYQPDDPRLPEAVRAFNQKSNIDAIIISPLVLGSSTLGWLTLTSRRTPECEGNWWRVVLIEAIARQAALALHHNRLAEQRQQEERRKAILEERNRLARDIHDNLAQGFAAILMQLQAAQREASLLQPAVAAKLETAIHLARTHMTEARRSVGTLRPNVSGDEDRSRSGSTNCRGSATAWSGKSSASHRRRSPTRSATRARSASPSASRASDRSASGCRSAMTGAASPANGRARVSA